MSIRIWGQSIPVTDQGHALNSPVTSKTRHKP